MTIKFTTTPIKKILESDRFEPRYHILFNRLDEYKKDSSYEIVKLGDKQLLKKITDGEHAGQVFVEKGAKFVKNSAVRDFSINLLDGFYISLEKQKLLQRSALKPLDILFTTVGHLGSTAIVPEDFGEANINQNVVKMEIFGDFLDPYYLAAYLNSNATKRQIAALFTGNIHGILTYPKVKNIRIAVPDKKFQDMIRSLYRKSIDLEKEAFALIEQAKNYFYEKIGIDFKKIEKEVIFSTKLSDFQKADLWTPSYSYPLYNNTIKALKKQWETYPLGEISTAKKGDEVGSENYNKYLEKGVHDVPFIRTSDIVNYDIDQYPDFYIPGEIYHELQQDIKSGDILFTNDGKIGLVAMLTSQDKAIIQSHIKRIRLKKEYIDKLNLSQEYLFLVLLIKEITLYQAQKYTVIQSTIPTISNHLAAFEVPILDKKSIDHITQLVKKAFVLKDERKKLIKEIREKIENKVEV
ncbi:MAG: hypothetical protein JNJ43_03380 [Anaerolineales bacterium]|nr:hypothetical protein [Anaerolineales bacterium]